MDKLKPLLFVAALAGVEYATVQQIKTVRDMALLDVKKCLQENGVNELDKCIDKAKNPQNSLSNFLNFN